MNQRNRGPPNEELLNTEKERRKEGESGQSESEEGRSSVGWTSFTHGQLLCGCI